MIVHLASNDGKILRGKGLTNPFPNVMVQDGSFIHGCSQNAASSKGVIFAPINVLTMLTMSAPDCGAYKS